MTVRAQIGGALDVEVVSWDGTVLQLVSPRPFAPGAPLRLSLPFVAGLALEGKSLGSKRRDDATFDVRVRLVNLRRETRLALDGTFRPGR